MESLPFPRLPKKYQYPKQKKYIKLYRKATVTLEDDKEKEKGKEVDNGPSLPIDGEYQ